MLKYFLLHQLLSYCFTKYWGKILERTEHHMKDIKQKLANTRELAPSVPYELHDFCSYLSKVTNPDLVPSGLIILLMCGLDDIRKEKCGFATKVEFPKKLKEEKMEIILYISWFPLIVDSFGDEEFANEFRELFERAFCKPQPKAIAKGQFEVKVLEDGRIDISKKDKAEVLAALYNASHPHGYGFLQFDAKPMTEEEARKILSETDCFDYLNGRVMKISLAEDVISVYGYDSNNGYGAAARAISGCPDR